MGLAVVAVAQPPADKIPLAGDTPTRPAAPVAAKVEVAPAHTVNANEAFAKALADARTACGKARDYTCHLVRQERVNGRLLPEQVCELRVRAQPYSVNVRVIRSKDVAGEETSFIASKSDVKVRFRAAGVDGIKYGFRTLRADDPKALAHTRHTAADTGLLAVLDRIEKAVDIEKRLHNGVQVVVGEYVFAGRPVTRFDIFADHPHPRRYAYRCVLYVDKETKLPIRFEAYDQPRGGSVEGELLEVQSFIGVRTNVGLGASAFER
jgi:hypothetical protein